MTEKHRERKRQEETERNRRTDGRTEIYKTDIARKRYREREKNRKREIDIIRRWVNRIVWTTCLISWNVWHLRHAERKGEGREGEGGEISAGHMPHRKTHFRIFLFNIAYHIFSLFLCPTYLSFYISTMLPFPFLSLFIFVFFWFSNVFSCLSIVSIFFTHFACIRMCVAFCFYLLLFSNRVHSVFKKIEITV